MSHITDVKLVGRFSEIDKKLWIYPYGPGTVLVLVYFDTDEKLQEFYRGIKAACGNKTEEEILCLVYKLVRERMKPDAEGKFIDELVKNQGKYGDCGRVIELGEFIDNAATCFIYALVCGVVLQRLIIDGLLKGRVHIEINEGERGKHAWCVYSNDKEVILDPALKFYGERNSPEAKWVYTLPDIA